MYFSQVLPIIFSALGLAITSPPCAHVTHSDCVDDDSHIFLETNALNKEACDLICAATGQTCHFSLFDRVPHTRGNCRLYDSSFSRFVLECNELSGPKTLGDDCDLETPEDNTCQIYREGKCDFGIVEETEDISSWESCNLFCRSISQCQLWRYEKEERSCKIMYSGESSCTWQFSPREPSFDECDDVTPPTTTTLPPTSSPVTTTLPPTTSTTITTTTTSDCPVPDPPKHGDWFCPHSTEVPTCHLECDPGYASTNATVITCHHGEWSSAPSCVAAVALITGNYDSPRSTVEVYSEGLHLLLPNLPDDRRYHSLDLVDSSVLLCGGLNTKTSCLMMTSSQQWVPHSTTTSPRNRHSSVSALGQLHLLGGYDSRSTSEYLARSSTTWSEGWQLLEDNYASCTAKVDAEVAMMTGGGSHRSSVISYNVTSGAAARLHDLITPTYRHGCCYVRDEGFRGVLVAGGWGGVLDFSQLYDINTGEWSTTGPLTTDRWGVRLFVIGDQILASGGYSGGHNTLSTVDRFNLTTRTWKAAEGMMEARGYHAVTAVPPSAVVLGSD